MDFKEPEGKLALKYCISFMLFFLLKEEPFFPGCVIAIRMIGLISGVMKDTTKNSIFL